MANLKEVRIRIASIISTQQITKAMKLVSATKLRRAQTAIIQMRPYSSKLNAILANLAESADLDSMKSLFAQREVKKVLIVVITSDRGLCGGFNANANKLAYQLIREKYAEQFTAKNVSVLVIGKKAFEYFGKLPVNLITDYKDIFHNLNADSVFEIGNYIIDSYKHGKFDEVEIVYNQFKNAATQILSNEEFLPVNPKRFKKAETKRSSKHLNDYFFEPTAAEILEDLIPRILKTQLYRSILDSHAAEHGARMISMDKATDNAGEILKDLRVEYNRARQAAITKEISEIVGGAAALNG